MLRGHRDISPNLPTCQVEAGGGDDGAVGGRIAAVLANRFVTPDRRMHVPLK